MWLRCQCSRRHSEKPQAAENHTPCPGGRVRPSTEPSRKVTGWGGHKSSSRPGDLGTLGQLGEFLWPHSAGARVGNPLPPWKCEKRKDVSLSTPSHGVVIESREQTGTGSGAQTPQRSGGRTVRSQWNRETEADRRTQWPHNVQPDAAGHLG